MSTRKPPAPKGEGDGKRPAKRRLTPRDGSPKPPKEGWTLEEAFRALAPQEFEDFRKAESLPLTFGRPFRLPNGEMTKRLTPEEVARSEARRMLWAAFQAHMLTGVYRAEGHRGSTEGPKTEIASDLWSVFGDFVLSKSAVREAGAAGGGFVAVRVFGASANRGGGRTAEYEWMKALDQLLTKIVDPAKIDTAAALAKALEDAFEDLGMEAPSDSAKWIRENLPKLNKLAKTPKSR